MAAALQQHLACLRWMLPGTRGAWVEMIPCLLTRVTSLDREILPRRTQFCMGADSHVQCGIAQSLGTLIKLSSAQNISRNSKGNLVAQPARRTFSSSCSSWSYITISSFLDEAIPNSGHSKSCGVPTHGLEAQDILGTWSDDQQAHTKNYMRKVNLHWYCTIEKFSESFHASMLVWSWILTSHWSITTPRPLVRGWINSIACRGVSSSTCSCFPACIYARHPHTSTLSHSVSMCYPVLASIR